MKQIDTMEKQHEEIGALASELSTLLDASKVKADPEMFWKHLFHLSGRIKIHLSMEDDHLYPALLASESREVRLKTKELQAEMGHIKDAFGNYMEQWSSTEQIASGPEDFVAQTKGIIEALGTRIQKEDAELYPMAKN